MNKNNKKWSLPTPTHVMKCIEKWRSLDLKKKTDAEIDSELSELLDSIETYVVSSVQTHFFELWRIRKFNYLFKDVSECWEPPASKAPMGRCNAVGKPVLYVSKELKTLFEELNVQPNEQVYVIKYKTTDSLNLKRIVSEDFEATDNKGNPIYDPESMLSYQILREFVRSEFLKPVGKGTEYLYRISASMCRVWFHDDDSDGWLYPSVQSPFENNIAIKSESAKEKLIIEDVRIVQLVYKDKVRNHKNRFESHPFFNMITMAIETDFTGEIVEDTIKWVTSTDVGGIF